MNHEKVKHYVSIVGIAALVVLGALYIALTPEPQPTVILTFAAGIAGLGGYNLRQRKDISK